MTQITKWLGIINIVQKGINVEIIRRYIRTYINTFTGKIIYTLRLLGARAFFFSFFVMFPIHATKTQPLTLHAHSVLTLSLIHI